MRLNLGSVLLISANSLPASSGVAIISLINVLQNTTLPAPIIAIFGFVIAAPPGPDKPELKIGHGSNSGIQELRIQEIRNLGIEGILSI
jgi:hypothetical protein